MLQQHGRPQRTIARTAKVSGFGLFCGADVTLEFCPAETDHGVVFERIDPVEPVKVPALIDFVVPQPRCTVIARGGVSVSVIEHVMAALVGLRIDNCLVRLDAPEPPVGDGSSLEFVEALLAVGIVEQDAERHCVVVNQTFLVTEDDHVGIAVQPSPTAEYEIGFVLDYGPGPISRQSLRLPITPESFVSDIADSRTFALEQEVQGLRQQGLALRATPQNALVFSSKGIVDNELRHADECVRHKILDCLGDFALLGCDIVGRFTAMRSGHRLNHAIIREIRHLRNSENSPHPGNGINVHCSQFVHGTSHASLPPPPVTKAG